LSDNEVSNDDDKIEENEQYIKEKIILNKINDS